MPKPYFQLKGGLFTLTVLHLQSDDLKNFEERLSLKVSKSTDFFHQLPIIVDLSQLPPETHHLDFNWLKNLLISKGMVPVALHNIPETLMAKANQSDWGIFPDIQPRYNKTETATPEPQETQPNKAESIERSPTVKLVTAHIRSGQQVYSDGDLIVVNTVNTGAEVLADGNIHVYGALKGRALAGVKGDTTARIFCQSLEAELISIAGKYKVIESDTDEWHGKAVQIYLDKDELIIEKFTKEL